MKTPIIIAISISVAAVIGLVILDQRVPAAAPSVALQPTAHRIADPTITRISRGPPTDLAKLPTTPIAPWDDSAVRDWMRTTLKTLEAEIDDPEIRRLGQQAADATLNATTAQALYEATGSAVPYLIEGDATERKIALYILLKSAVTGRDDPYTMFRIAAYLEEYPETFGTEFLPDMYRLAADRDFLPAIVNFAHVAANGAYVPPDDLEAYLRYGVDMDGEDGGWNILSYLSNFYFYDFPDRDSQGYLHKVAKRYRQLGDEQRATMTEYQMYLDDREVTPAPVVQFAAARRALASGNFWVAGNIGLAYMNGDGVEYDRDLARDYLVTCLRFEPMGSCAVNLAALYWRDFPNDKNSALAVAFYKYALDLDADGTSEAAANAREKLAERFPKLNADGIAQMDIYYAAITSGDYSKIPHLKDARPVPELAEDAPAE